MNRLTVINCAVVEQHLLEETIEKRVVGHHLFEHREQNVDGDGIEIIVDVDFVCPHLLFSYGVVDVQDGIPNLHASAERIAVGGKKAVVVIEFKGNDLEHHHLLRRKAIHHPLLTRAHLVDDFLRGHAQTFALHQLFYKLEILFPLYETIGFIELMPGETAFQQPISDELIPDVLSGQLCDDALHEKKRKRGKV